MGMSFASTCTSSTGRPEVNALYGPLSVKEELDSELEALKTRIAAESRHG